MSKVNEIMEIVKGMTVLELSELVKALEEEFESARRLRPLW